MSIDEDDMIPIIENPKESTQNLPKLTNEFSKVAKYKINIQQLVAFLYTNNEILEKGYLKNTFWSSHRGTVEMNPTGNHKVAGSIPGLAP